MKKRIDPSHKLPCDFIVGPIRYGKGIKLETIRQAAERWYNALVEYEKPDSVKLAELAEHMRVRGK